MKANPYGGEQKITFRVTLGGPEEGAQLLGVDQQDFESYLTRFRQLISPRDNAYIGRLLRLVPRHIDDPGLRDRLSAARQMWDVAHGVPSPIAALSLGRFAAGTETARLYFYGVGIIHSDTDMVALWDALPKSKRQLVAWAFHQYEAKVRRVANDLHHILREPLGMFVQDCDWPLHLAKRTAGGCHAQPNAQCSRCRPLGRASMEPYGRSELANVIRVTPLSAPGANRGADLRPRPRSPIGSSSSMVVRRWRPMTRSRRR